MHERPDAKERFDLLLTRAEGLPDPAENQTKGSRPADGYTAKKTQKRKRKGT